MGFMDTVCPFFLFLNLEIHMDRVICSKKKRYQMDYLKPKVNNKLRTYSVTKKKDLCRVIFFRKSQSRLQNPNKVTCLV